MKYESDILKRLINTYGVVGNPRYISEIIKEFIVRGKERFPELFTYQADWLAHIDEFGLNPSYTVSYTGQSIYAPNTLERPVKSAILKGSTKYRDIDTGEFLETFEEGRNLELVSVRMPVLTVTNGNLLILSPNTLEMGSISGTTGGVVQGNTRCHTTNIKVSQKDDLFLKRINCNYQVAVRYYYGDTLVNKSLNNNGSFIVDGNLKVNGGEDYDSIKLIFAKSDNSILTIEEVAKQQIMLVPNNNYTTYEPHKTNILTVNEDVTLRSNGSVYDELDLLTGKLTQRIDEDGEVLIQEVVKTVELTIQNQNGQIVKQLMSFNGGTHFNTGSLEGSPLPSVSVSVETDLEETLKVCSLEGNTM